MDTQAILSEITESPLGLGFEAISQFSATTWAQRLVLTVWAAHTWTYRTFVVTPRLFFCADGPATGKTVNMQATVSMAKDPLKIGYASQSSVYSYLEAHPDTTFALDEIDKAFGADGRKTSRAILASVVNEGYTSDGTVMVNRGTKATLMPVYAPIAMAGIGTLPHDTLTRCISIKLEKGTPNMMFMPELYKKDMAFIGEKFSEWLNTKQSQDFLKSQPMMANYPGEPRFRLMTAPLFAIADLAGIGEIFHLAMKEVVTGISENPPKPKHVLFIQDLREVWPDDVKLMDAGEIVRYLHEHPGRRWDDLSDTRIGQMAVSGMMRENGVQSTVTDKRRGYLRRDVARLDLGVYETDI